MSLKKGKHTVQELEGVLCTVIESDISAERFAFLKELLEFNGFQTKYKNGTVNENQMPLYQLGVTDLVFNPVIAVFSQSLKRPGGGKVSPTYWNQEEEIENLPYFDYREKNPDAKNEDDFQLNPWTYRTI